MRPSVPPCARACLRASLHVSVPPPPPPPPRLLVLTPSASAGLQCDYTRCPDRHAQDAFLRSYLQTIADHRAGGRAPPVPDHDVDALFLEVTPYWLVTHLMWGHWALYLARVQGMPDVPEHVPPTGTPMTAESFDYRVFAAMRFRQYYAMRGDEFHRLGLDV